MKTWVVENKDQSIRVAHVHADTSAGAIQQIAEHLGCKASELNAYDHEGIDKAYWAAMAPKPEKPKEEFGEVTEEVTPKSRKRN